MITTNIANKYDKIFAEAFKILDGHVTNEDNSYWDACVKANKMVNLDAYFISFGTLLSLIDEKEQGPFVLLPLDEEPFEINANTREIKVPTPFKKGVAVQGDCGSEILVFTIDRYFDYVDLNNMDVWIQYTTPDKKERAYQVDLFDRNSIPGKIRFGWLLGPDVTESNGNLKFSVRFFKRAEENPNIIDYSFNTLPQTINIYSALQPKINETTDKYTNALFKKVVRNSLEAGALPADAPRFDTEPAEDLPVTASLDNDTLTLEALATVTDNGSISYEWFYSPTGADKDYDVIVNGDVYTVDNATSVKAVKNPKATNLIKYYIDSNCEVEYSGDFIFDAETVLYKKVSTCTINPSTEDSSPIVTGFYRVNAQNTLTTSNKSNPVASSICKLLSPENLDIVNKLDYMTDSVVLGNTISLTVKVDPMATALCTWKRIKDEIITIVNEEAQAGHPDEKGEVTFTLTPEVDGYYYAEITSLLNRTTIALKAEDKTNMVVTDEFGAETVVAELPTPADRKNIVRVTNEPAVPTFADDKPEPSEGYGFLSLTPDANGIYEVKSYINQIPTGDFTSDKQTYIWNYSVADLGKDDKVISSLVDFVDGAIDGPTIKIKHNHIPTGSMVVWCESFNTLNKKDSAKVRGPEFILGFNIEA